MSFNQNDVEKLADLARIAIDQNLSASITEDLRNILAMLNAIDKVNTDNIEAMAHTNNLEQPLRKDLITESDVRSTMQKLVDQQSTIAGLYLVPKVVE